jgi:hypothetical protein
MDVPHVSGPAFSSRLTTRTEPSPEVDRSGSHPETLTARGV